MKRLSRWVVVALAVAAFYSGVQAKAISNPSVRDCCGDVVIVTG